MDLYVFMTIGLVGFLFIVISFLMGEVAHLGDLGHAGDLGGAGHEIHVGDSHGDHGGAGHDSDSDGPGPLSTRVISIFLTAFGAAATAARLSGLAPITSAAVGVATGYGLGWCTWRFMRLVWSQGASSHLRTSDLEGATGEVTIAIPASGPGQVACVAHGMRTHQIARSATKEAIPLGSIVRITQVTPEGVLVEPVANGSTPGSEPMKERF